MTHRNTIPLSSTEVWNDFWIQNKTHSVCLSWALSVKKDPERHLVTTSGPSFALSVVPVNARENRGKKLVTRTPGDFMRPFFLAVFIRVTHDGLNERGPFHARIRFGEKWRPRSRRHNCETGNGGLGAGGEIKTERKRRERNLKDGRTEWARKKVVNTKDMRYWAVAPCVS